MCVRVYELSAGTKGAHRVFLEAGSKGIGMVGIAPEEAVGRKTTMTRESSSQGILCPMYAYLPSSSTYLPFYTGMGDGYEMGWWDAFGRRDESNPNPLSMIHGYLLVE